MKELIIATVIMAALAGLTGCGHNINVQGWGLACPYGAMGYGTFSCTKDNVKVIATEETTESGVKSTSEFIVGKQTTGYDVELAEIKKEIKEKTSMQMQIKDVNGVVHDVDMPEAKRFFHEVRRHLVQHGRQEPAKHETEHENHKFHINGSEVSISPEEMKKIADSWWENYGQNTMLGFFEKYQNKAAENIRTALGHCEKPTCEKEVKAAIAQALCIGDPGLIAEVMFEATEWCNAYIGLKSIEED